MALSMGLMARMKGMDFREGLRQSFPSQCNINIFKTLLKSSETAHYNLEYFKATQIYYQVARRE